MRKILLATAAGFAALVANGATPTAASAQTQATGQTPAPGLTLSTTGRIRFHGALIGQDGRAADNGRKLSNYDFNTYGRVRFDLSGRSAEGLIYGGRIEARIAPQVEAPTGNANVFLRVVNGFVGTPTLGQIRFGSNGVLAVPQMFVGHIMGTIGTGLWDGDAGDYFFLGQGGIVPSSFWYSASGNVNRATGIGYYSPQFFGFDFGISYAANESAFLGGCNAATATFLSCDRAATVDATSARKFRNIIDVMLRYRGTFSGVGIAASGGLRTADTTNTIPGVARGKDPTVGIVGAEVTFAGFTVGGITTFGSANRGFANGASLLPKTGAGLDSGLFSWQLGARYSFGAFTVGAAYHELRSEGSVTNANNLREKGFGIGGSYALGPGLALFAEYLYGTAKESGRDLNALRAGTQDSFKSQLFLLGLGMGF